MLVLDLWANLAKHGPACGLSPRRSTRRTLHAVTADAVIRRIADKRTTVDAPCGERVRILTGDVGPYMWPPRIASLPEGWERCTECHQATGRKRPHPAWSK